MAEKRLIDANALSAVLKNEECNCEVFPWTVDNAPTVDAVEVVRCVECLYRSQYSDDNGLYHCGGIDTTEEHALPVVAPDFFCAHGERRLYGEA